MTVKGGKGVAFSTREPALAGCRDLLERELSVLLKRLFLKVEDAFYDLADKSENNTRYARYFHATRGLNRQRDAIENQFLANLANAGNAWTSGLAGEVGADPVTRREQGLALVEHEELEESLAVANLISKAESRHRGALLALRRQQAALIGRETIDSRTDPLGPHVICNAFRAALEPVGEYVDLDLRLVVYKLFDKHVMDHVGHAYACCLELLESSPVAEWDEVHARIDVDQRGRTRNVEAPEDPNADTAEMVESAADSPATAASGVAAFEDLQHLLEARRPSRQSSPGGEIVAGGELMSALTRLQTRAQESAAGELSPKELFRQLRAELQLQRAYDGGPLLDRRDEDTLDLVFLLFESILHANDLPDAFKSLVGRLQIPIAKVALSDKSFFDHTEHPARRLLNHLAEYAVGWIDDGDRSTDSPYARIEHTVTRVLDEYDRDPAIFAELDSELTAELERQRTQFAIREARTKAELEGKERHRSARARVRETIEERLRGGPRVPEMVSSLLREGWRDVLLRAYLQGGVDGPEWRDSLATMELLLWSVRPKIWHEDRRELLRRIPVLLRDLRESLAAVAFDQRRLSRWFRELQALHISALRGAGPAPETGSFLHLAGSDDLGRGETELSGEPGAQGLAPENRVGLEDAAGLQLALGTWLEVRRDDVGVLRVKLAWRSPDTDLHLFVDRRGLKALELSGKELAALFRRGMVTKLSGLDAPLVDRAMEVVMESLKRK
jgi:hypothetical protein